MFIGDSARLCAKARTGADGAAVIRVVSAASAEWLGASGGGQPPVDRGAQVVDHCEVCLLDQPDLFGGDRHGVVAPPAERPCFTTEQAEHHEARRPCHLGLFPERTHGRIAPLPGP